MFLCIDLSLKIQPKRLNGSWTQLGKLDPLTWLGIGSLTLQWQFSLPVAGYGGLASYMNFPAGSTVSSGYGYQSFPNMVNPADRLDKLPLLRHFWNLYLCEQCGKNNKSSKQSSCRWVNCRTKGLSTPEMKLHSSRIDWTNCRAFEWQFVCSFRDECPFVIRLWRG